MIEGKRKVEMRYTKDIEFGLLLRSTKVKVVYCGSVPEETTSDRQVAITRYASKLIAMFSELKVTGPRTRCSSLSNAQ
ncbi:Uncharacterized protein TCM_003828 [Theobroma cacao]|uniref:Uncharacterized protein n=1 Tax=Theobroma cacao TaxID=3641 RepID=A0A061DW94_THECC|nr:Uncharacterized protein TCM_003828 [Theobroma cacao]